mmetsp:Transcript_52550/g.153139  ORF Transcript_52550/g.153139 Transcript_52550/m.153139 type:complete len:202 (+) Transcript_52550:1328-1933(+)
MPHSLPLTTISRRRTWTPPFKVSSHWMGHSPGIQFPTLQSTTFPTSTPLIWLFTISFRTRTAAAISVKTISRTTSLHSAIVSVIILDREASSSALAACWSAKLDFADIASARSVCNTPFCATTLSSWELILAFRSAQSSSSWCNLARDSSTKSFKSPQSDAKASCNTPQPGSSATHFCACLFSSPAGTLGATVAGGAISGS